jgi:hypothetical protein
MREVAMHDIPMNESGEDDVQFYKDEKGNQRVKVFANGEWQDFTFMMALMSEVQEQKNKIIKKDLDALGCHS